MAKSFKIVNNPTFTSVVKVPRIGGEPLEVPFTFKVMDRKGLAKTFDRWKKETADLYEQVRSTEEGEEITLEEWATKEIELQIRQIKDIVVGWKFDDEFNDENIELLVSTSVGVPEAIIEQYHEGYSLARRGN